MGGAGDVLGTGTGGPVTDGGAHGVLGTPVVVGHGTGSDGPGTGTGGHAVGAGSDPLCVGVGVG